eukprot:Rmarinus@m.4546
MASVTTTSLTDYLRFLKADGSFHSLLEREIWILQRLLYRFRNQHRRFIHFRKVIAVVRMLRKDAPWVIYKPILQELRKQEVLSNRPECQQLLYGSLVALRVMVAHTATIHSACIHACQSLSSMIGNTFFMQLSLVLSSALARVNTLLRNAAVRCVKLFNELRPNLSLPNVRSLIDAIDARVKGWKQANNSEPRGRAQLLHALSNVPTHVPSLAEELPLTIQVPEDDS